MAYLVNEIDDEKFSIPENETAIGRGAFLKVTEKRVSRKHAVVKYEDGKMFVKPVHNNPTFFCSSSTSEFLPLTKDVWKQLKHGDVIALLPDTLKFTVCIKVDQTQEYDLESFSEEKDSSAATVSATTVSKNKVDQDNVIDDSSLLPKNDFSKENDRNDLISPQRKRKLPDWMLNITVGSGKEQSSTKAKRNKSSSTSSTKPTCAKPIKSEEPIYRKSPLIDKPKPANKSNEANNSTEDDISNSLHNQSSESPRRVDQSKACDNLSLPDNVVNAKDDDDVLKPGSTSKAKTQSSHAENSLLAHNDQADESSHSKNKENIIETISLPQHTLASSSNLPKTTTNLLATSTNISATTTTTNIPATTTTADLPATTTTADLPATTTTADLPVCPYGASCYRKNPLHFVEYSHLKEDDLPECPYGTSCYRKNPEHINGYKHTKQIDVPISGGRSTRKRRQVKGKSVLDNTSDDDGENNSYDYNDSFLDETDESEDSFTNDDASDSDYNPGGNHDDGSQDDDVKDLIKEANEFVNNPKMQN